MRAKFSTDMLEAPARFEAFRDDQARRMFGMDMVCRTDAVYSGVVDTTVTAAAKFGRILGSPAEVFRSANVAGQQEEGAWALFNRSGRLRVMQGEIDRELMPGEGIVFNEVRPHAFHCMDDTDTFCIKVSDHQMTTLRPRDGGKDAALIGNGNPLAALISGMLEAYYRTPPDTAAQVEFATGTYLCDLMALALGASRNGSYLAGKRGLMAARRQAVLDAIAESFTDPGISAESLARRLGMTPRYVHLLLADTGRTVSEHVLERRLVLAWRLLTDPGRDAVRISEIAYRCGFSDLSYFNRTFRRRFEQTPTDARSGDGRPLSPAPVATDDPL